MRKVLLILAIICSVTASFGQVVVWSEDFGTPPAGTSANGFNNGNGAWTVTNTGANGSDSNEWMVSGEECGNAAGACGSVCSGGDASLHLGPNFALFGDPGAAYAAGGGGFFFIETDKRVESPVIDLTGQTNLTLNFNYLEDYAGQAGYDPGDDATLWYFDGATWTLLDPLAVTPATCSPQGTWTAFSIALPASADNNPNVKIGFHWFNNDDNVGTDPSFAVDDIEITTPATAGPTADFSASVLTICEGDCIDFTDLSTLGTNPSWSWTFTGADITSSTNQNPTGICYSTAGTYQVELTVTDDNGTDTETKIDYITVNAPPNAGSNASQNLCNNTTLDLNTVLTGQDAGGTWVETSGTPSGQFNAGTGVLDGNGLTPSNVYTFDYTVTGVAPCPDATATVTITIIDCSAGPIADFSASSVTICEGDCIDFTDLSALGTNPTWSWTFTGADITSSTNQNPTGICYSTAGTYQVELTVTDDNGTDTETKVNYITVDPQADAGADVNSNECEGITVDVNTLLSGADAGGTWVETTGTPSGQFTAGTGDFNTTGLPIGNSYTFEYTVGTAPCDDVSTVTVTIQDCSVLNADFTPSETTICIGECLTFTDNSTGPITSWSWTFNGADTPTASGQDPGSICWSASGDFDVVLEISDGTNTDVAIVQITVLPDPIVTATASPGDTICTGDQVVLTGGGANNYVWDNGVTDGVAFTPTATATYTVTGTNLNGCSSDATIEVVVEDCDPLIAGFSFPGPNICVGDCITFTDTSSGNITSWYWDFGSGASPDTAVVPDPTICFVSTGTYNIQLTITDAAGNNASTTQSITVFPVPSVTAELDTLIDLGGEVELIADGSVPGNYQWDPFENVDCDTCAVTFAKPLVYTEYIVTLTDVNGCSAEDTVYVEVNFIEGIGVPSAFSPNGDGNNDVLFVKGLTISSMNFSIYNRYGQKVFETYDQSIGWDGTFKGRDENSGVFTWVLEYTLINNSSGVLKGNTTLIR
ncbi:MAG: PKD domain-containing protein [Crocinitomicaceae bacterium]